MRRQRGWQAWLISAALLWSLTGPAAAADVPPMWQDDLEAADTLADLFPPDGSRFTQLQVEHGGGCALERDIVHAGASAIRCVALATGDAKADLGRQDISADVPGQPAPPRFGPAADPELWAEMWLYVVDTGRCEGLFLWDVEESAANNAGLRVHCKTDPATGIDYLKMNSEFGPSFQPPAPFTQFPLDRWTRLRVYVRFHALVGTVRLWVDEALVLDARGPTARRGRSIYDSLQWGATVNASDRTQVVYFDDLKVWNSNPGW